MSTNHVILGTAGHIDHGKTSIVKALTGVDTDWLPEEKARGMTIDIGIAHCELDGEMVGLVDVPGHERFVRTMVAGASGIDVALLVVAADDGVMPQTVEHFEIVSLLGVERGVVAINKADLVDEARVEEVKAEVRELLRGTALADVPMITVSAVNLTGIDDLRAALEEEVRRADRGKRSRFFRLPIDRIFSIPGRGTVVTGSMLGGTVSVGDQVELLPRQESFRVRGLQVHKSTVEDLGAGQRTAVNLAGIKKEELRRGMELAAPGYLVPSTFMDVEARCLPSVTKGLNSYVRVRLAIGTSEVLGRLVNLQGKHLAAGDNAFCQLRLYEPVVAEFGQRFILRDETAVRTVGGGHILRPVARRTPANRAVRECEALRLLIDSDLETRVTQAVAQAGVNRNDERADERAIAARSRGTVEEVRAILERLEAEGTLVRLSGVDYPLHVQAFNRLGERVLRFLKRFHQNNAQVVGIELGVLRRTFQRSTAEAVFDETLRRLKAENQLVFKLKHVALAGHQTQMSESRRKLWDRVHQALLDGGAKPPTEGALAEIIGGRKTAIKEILELAEAQGDVIHVGDGIYFPLETFESIQDKIRELHASLGPFSISAFREYIGSSRKYVVPLCEFLDRQGFTRRDGDLRVLQEQ